MIYFLAAIAVPIIVLNLLGAYKGKPLLLKLAKNASLIFLGASMFWMTFQLQLLLVAMKDLELQGLEMLVWFQKSIMPVGASGILVAGVFAVDTWYVLRNCRKTTSGVEPDNLK
jgi:hypothetical protein